MGKKALPGVVAAAAVALTLAGVHAQQPSGQQAQPPAGQQAPARGQQPAAPAGQAKGPQAAPAALPKPLEPVAASTLATHPDPYYGQHVTMTAAVGQVLSKTAFSVEQNTPKTAGESVLVLTPPLQGTLEPSKYVTVIGQVVKVDADKLKEMKVDVSPDLIAKYNGKPAIVATGVINSAFVDLTKRMPPPMTPDEEALSKIMKKIGPAFGAIRGSAEGAKADVATQNAATLKQAFGETEAFWKSHGKSDAEKWAQGARKNAETIEKAASSGKWDEVKSSTAALGQACQSCHAAYRERFDDGSFRIKTAAPAKPGK